MSKLKNATFFNIICSLSAQIITLIGGLIIPKLILSSFGSEINGLVSSISQFLSYVSLIEGGVSGVVVASMYKPLYNKDYNKLSSVVKTSKMFYRKIAFILVIYTLIVAILYPLFFNIEYSFSYVFSLVLILSLNSLIQYTFAISYKLLLNADKKVYVVSITHSISTILSIILAYISIKIYPSIHIFKILTTIAFIIEPIAYSMIVNKKYSLNKKNNADEKLLKNRWDGFAINIAAFIHFNTDVVLLTIFTNLETVSVYSVYSLVITGLQTIVVSISNGISPSIGHIYASGDMEKLKTRFNNYEFWLMFLIFALFSTAVLLITPFVMLYTKNITDVNYYEPLFGFLIIIAEVIYLIKIPHTDLAYAANKFKDISKHAYIEATINILTSILLIKQLGLVGVAIGTLVGMLYRTAFQVWYLKKEILMRKVSIFLKKLVVFTAFSAIAIAICILLIPKTNIDISDWILHGAIYFVIIVMVLSSGGFLFYRKEILSINKYILKTIKKGV